jgi:hypothetical protein
MIGRAAMRVIAFHVANNAVYCKNFTMTARLIFECDTSRSLLEVFDSPGKNDLPVAIKVPTLWLRITANTDATLAIQRIDKPALLRDTVYSSLPTKPNLSREGGGKQRVPRMAGWPGCRRETSARSAFFFDVRGDGQSAHLMTKDVSHGERGALCRAE